MEPIKISPNGENLYGYYRRCEESTCSNFIKCPFIRCQEHRTDFAINDNTISHIIPENIDALKEKRKVYNFGLKLFLGMIRCKKENPVNISGVIRYEARFYFNKIKDTTGYYTKSEKTVEALSDI